MKAKFVITGAICALVAFVSGAYFGIRRSLDAPPPPPPTIPPAQARAIADQRAANDQLQAEIGRLQAEIARLAAAQAELTAARARPPAPSTPAPRTPVTAASPPAEQQRAMLNNLRQIAAARDQFMLENRRAPASLDEIVGETRYIKRLVSIDGENYAALPLARGQTMAVTTQNGVTASYDPTPTARPPTQATYPEWFTPQMTQMADRLGPLVIQAQAAYQAAHPGQQAREPNDLLPYFATPQHAADYLEFNEALQARSPKR